jgi:MFS family permease
MLARTLSTWLQRRGLHYGWVIVAVTFLVMLTTSAALGLPGVLLRPLGAEFGWNTQQISGALAVRFALYGLMAPFAAMLLLRYGLRRIVGIAMALVAISMVAATQLTDLPQLVFYWGVALGVGSGLTALVLGATVANRWFEARRGLVVGLLTASAATGQLLFLPLAAWIIENFGWRAALTPVFIACSLVAALAVTLLRDRPEDLGLLPYGADPTAKPAPTPERLSLWAPLGVLASVWRHPTFLILFGTFFICGLSTNGLIQTHFVMMCGDFGMAALPAASVLAVMGAFDLVGTIGSGWLSDRYDNRKLLLWYYGLRGLSLLWLPHSGFTLLGLSVFALFYGLDWIATVPPTVKLAATVAGKERAGMVFGWVFAGHQLGAAAAAAGAGTMRTLWLTYSPALYMAGAACLVAAFAAMAIPRQQREAAMPVLRESA